MRQIQRGGEDGIPSARPDTRFDTRGMVLAALFAALLAVFSQLAVPMVPVPINLGLLAVYLCALALEPRWALISVGLYLAMGAVGAVGSLGLMLASPLAQGLISSDGWKVAMGTLTFERGVSTLGQQIRYARELSSLAELAQRNGAADDPLIRDWVERCKARPAVQRGLNIPARP